MPWRYVTVGRPRHDWLLQADCGCRASPLSKATLGALTTAKIAFGEWGERGHATGSLSFHRSRREKSMSCFMALPSSQHRDKSVAIVV